MKVVSALLEQEADNASSRKNRKQMNDTSIHPPDLSSLAAHFDEYQDMCALDDLVDAMRPPGSAGKVDSSSPEKPPLFVSPPSSRLLPSTAVGDAAPFSSLHSRTLVFAFPSTCCVFGPCT